MGLASHPVIADSVHEEHNQGAEARLVTDLRTVARADGGEASGELVLRLLKRVRGGDPEARAELFDLVYEELHGRAQSYMRAQPRNHSLGATALVHANREYGRAMPLHVPEEGMMANAGWG